MESPRSSSTLKISGTGTFRLASTKILKRYGGNLQNIEKNLRRIYIPDNGYKFCQVDQAGAEALIVAYIAPKGAYRDLFQYRIKPHVFVALRLFKNQWRQLYKDNDLLEAALIARVSELSSLPNWKDLNEFIKSSDNWPSKQRYYYLGKKTAHAAAYGLGANTFLLAILEETGGNIVLTRKEAEIYLGMFHELFPEIRRWHQQVQAKLSKARTLHNLFGYPYQYTGFIGEDMFKEAYAFVPQSTVGTITNIAYTKLQNYIEENNKDWTLLANTHDSYLAEYKEEDEEEIVAKMREFIEPELTSPDGTKFKMRSEAAVGWNWAPWKEGKNEKGLKEL